MTTLISIDTTPNPNSMKLNLSHTLGISGTYTKENEGTAPDVVQQLLAIQGVVSVFSAASFLTLNRDPRIDWQPILEVTWQVFTGKTSSVEAQRRAAEHQGQVTGPNKKSQLKVDILEGENLNEGSWLQTMSPRLSA